MSTPITKANILRYFQVPQRLAFARVHFGIVPTADSEHMNQKYQDRFYELFLALKGKGFFTEVSGYYRTIKGPYAHSINTAGLPAEGGAGAETGRFASTGSSATV